MRATRPARRASSRAGSAGPSADRAAPPPLPAQSLARLGEALPPSPPRGGPFDCRACGACCAFSADWPRFTIEDEADLARLPPDLVDDARGRMRCRGDRCAALRGDVGVQAACAVYVDRPEVCRACEPGDAECLLARRRFGLPVR